MTGVFIVCLAGRASGHILTLAWPTPPSPAHTCIPFRWMGRKTDFLLPPSLTKALLLWINKGHPLVAEGVRTLFVHFGSRGPVPMSNQQLPNWYSTLQSQHHTPFSPRITPNDLRCVALWHWLGWGKGGWGKRQ